MAQITREEPIEPPANAPAGTGLERLDPSSRRSLFAYDAPVWPTDFTVTLQSRFVVLSRDI